MKTSLRLSLMAPLSLGWLASCSSNPDVNIGDPIGAALTDYAASWDGYAEAYQFDDQSDRIRLVLDGAGVGKLRVGNAALFPAASDPNVGYPPGITFDKGLFSSLSSNVVAGFTYPVHGTRLQDSRIQLGVDPKDLYAGWCALQTPVFDDANNTYACVPNWGFDESGDVCSQNNPTTQETVNVDCGKLALCLVSSVCACTASGCAAALTPDSPSVQLDAALSADGSELTGTLVLNGQRITVRMHR